jgi:mxaK protein
MRRRAVHLGFAAAATVLAAACGWQGWRLHTALRLQDAVATATAAPQATARDDEPAAARLARAVALARIGQHDAALKLYAPLVRAPDDGDALMRTALFDLGNLYLRQGLDGNAPPMLELAKQRYRDLLRLDPGDWDARYNLERALWLAPESDDAYAAQEIAEQRRVRLRGMAAGDLP